MDSTQPSDGPSRFVVGIDLGTTNSAVGYIDTLASTLKVETLLLPQIIAAGQVEALDTLPSFHYEAAAGEFAAGALKLPWMAKAPTYCVGAYARDHGARVPGRLISSAKSWLCHAGVDRTAALLPWQAPADVPRLSPVEASSRYLQHIRASWDQHFPEFPLAQQDIVLTLPASFDEVARELTIRAAQQAGLPRVVLLEEPQAAFYDWIQCHPSDWQQRVVPGQKILVCDIGGGTSDFTLIRVRKTPKGELQFQRVAVGEHLILGGDNFDLALAHHVEQKLTGAGQLPPQQWGTLVRACRQVKEELLAANPPEHYAVNLPGSGSRLIGSSRQVELTRAEVEQVLVDGFLPRVALTDRPAIRRSGFQEFGLPFAPDAAITRYLAQFLTVHRHVALEPEDTAGGHDPARPDLLLFNGGVFAAPLIQQRLVDVVTEWFGGANGWQPQVLDHSRLDLAVAHGAAYYGLVRRGIGVRIAAGLPRTYYMEVATGSDNTALCVLPAGTEPGQAIELPEHQFELLIRQPVEFPLHVSSTRLVDKPGELVPLDREQLTPLPPIRTVLTARKADESDRVHVTLHAKPTEIGTLELWCAEVGGPRTWRLQFDVRAATQTDAVAHEGTGERQGFLEDAVIAQCRQQIAHTFAPTGEPAKPDELIRQLEATTDASRERWPSSLLRELWQATFDHEQGRNLGANFEARWLNLLGYALRPGYGLAVDDWRVAQTWKLFQGRKLFHPVTNCRIEYLVLWRRIAGGLAAGPQQALAEPLLALLRPQLRSLPKSKSAKAKGPINVFGFGAHETAEAWRLLGSLELLPVSLKTDLGQLLIQLLPRETTASIRAAQLWTLARLGARVPVYGPLQIVLPPTVVEDWLDTLLSLATDDDQIPLALMLLARKTQDRYRDVNAKIRSQVLVDLERRGAKAHWLELVRDGGELEAEAQGQVFGEALPPGLRIR